MKDNSDGKVALSKTKLKELRKQHGLSQESLAEACANKRLRVSIATIKRAEAGKNISYRSARYFAIFYNVDIATLLPTTTEGANKKASYLKPLLSAERLVSILVCQIFKKNVIKLHGVGNSHFGRLHSRIQSIAEAFGGVVYQQDAVRITIVFGLPPASANHTMRSALCAIQLRDALSSEFSSNKILSVSIHEGLADRVGTKASPSDKKKNYSIKSSSLANTYALSAITPCNKIWITHTIKLTVDMSVACSVVDESICDDYGALVWQLNTVLPLSFRQQNIFVGRLLERRNMMSMLESCMGYKRSQILHIRGLAGIGKTRLVQELQNVAQKKGFDCHYIQVDSYLSDSDKNVLGLFVQNLLGISPYSHNDNKTIDIAKILNRIGFPDSDITHVMATIGEALPADRIDDYEAIVPSVKRLGRVHALQNLLRILSSDSPLFVCFEDMHWADHYVIEFLQQTMHGLENIPIMMVLTSRIENDSADKIWNVGVCDAPFTVIDIPPLGMDDSLQLAAQFDHATEKYIKQSVDRAQGNPLFLEQLLHEPLNNDVLPYSLQMLVHEKLDALEDLDKQALRIAAVIGQHFSLEILRFLLGAKDYAPDRLIRHIFIKHFQDEYTFVHALVRQGIYDAIQIQAKQSLHNELAKLFAEKDKALYARHLILAGDARAVAALYDYATEQYNTYQYEQVPLLIDEALSLASSIDEQFDCLLLKAKSLRQLGQNQKALAEFEKALFHANAALQRTNCLIEIAICCDQLELANKAEDALDEAQAIADTNNLLKQRAIIHNMRGNSYFPRDPASCEIEHKLALTYSQQVGNPSLIAHAYGGLGDAHYAMGKMNSAFHFYQQCLQLCREYKIVQVESSNLSALASVRIYRFELAEALHEAGDSIALAQKTEINAPKSYRT